jgi:uncharacterized protein YdaU (DUF1376 family)
MPRARVSRLSWVRFFPEDFLGGVAQMDCQEVGQYILALCAQWCAERGAERTGLRPSEGALRAVLRGEMMTDAVRSKFREVALPSGKFLRNERMSNEIQHSEEEHAARSRGAERTAERPTERPAERTQTTTTTRTTTKEQKEEQTDNQRNGSEDEFATRFLAICSATFGRKYRVVDPEVKKKLKARLKDWKPWQILAAPILVAAQVPDRVANLSPEIILRDGSNPRTRDGQTYGGFYWLAKTYERVDGTKLDARLRSIAREAEVLEPLLACGVVVDADA